jgi:hypothetical protein
MGGVSLGSFLLLFLTLASALSLSITLPFLSLLRPNPSFGDPIRLFGGPIYHSLWRPYLTLLSYFLYSTIALLNPTL